MLALLFGTGTSLAADMDSRRKEHREVNLSNVKVEKREKSDGGKAAGGKAT
jgi:hypothetical protein